MHAAGFSARYRACMCDAWRVAHAQHVRRAMLPNNHTVFKKSFADSEGSCITCFPCTDALGDLIWPAALDGNQVLDFYWTDPINAWVSCSTT